MNLHFNYSISRNVRQNKEVGELFIKTKGETAEPHSPSANPRMQKMQDGHDQSNIVQFCTT
jgi:hypothetical protein